MRRIRIKHLTKYEYGRTVDFLPHKLLLRPREGHDVRIASSRLEIEPANTVKWHRDVNDNCVAVVTFLESGDCVSFLSEVVIEHYEEAPFDFVIDAGAANFPFHYDATEGTELTAFQISVFPEDNKALRKWLSSFWQPRQKVETYVLLDRINKAIHDQIEYKAREEAGVQSPVATLTQKTGSCRDMATLFIEACRQIGFAARFVSGYLHSPASQKNEGSTHAWSEIYLPGAGWKGFDSTSGELVGSQHIPVAVSRHPEAVPPIAGAFLGIKGLKPIMSVNVEVNEIP
ncbi:MAG: transglutaminase family protein [Gammaproteobacteria bacterium]